MQWKHTCVEWKPLRRRDTTNAAARVQHRCKDVEANGGYPSGGYSPGTARPRCPQAGRAAISHSQSRPSRLSRRGEPVCTMGGLRPRLLLAPARRLPPQHHSQAKRRPVASEIRRERRSGRSCDGVASRARIPRPGGVGVRSRRRTTSRSPGSGVRSGRCIDVR